MSLNNNSGNMPPTRKDSDKCLLLYPPIIIQFCGGFFKTLLTVKSKSDSVSSMIILGACHLPGKILIYVLYYMHLPPFNSVEVLGSSGKIVCTVSSKSDSVSSIPILEACHLLEKTVIDVLYHMHLPPFNSVEVFF